MARRGRMAALVCLGMMAGPAKADYDEAVRACQRYQAIPLPKGEGPNAKTAELGARCDSETLYYGFESPAQPAKARECAYGELGRRDPSQPFSGEAILTMVYANGRGAARNLDLALKFACEMDAAPAEMESRIAHLEKLKTGDASGSGFDICDDITSGYMGGFCTEKQDRFDRVQREKKLRAITAQWSPQEGRALELLRRAAKAFFAAHSSNEIDLSGSGRAGFEIEENARLENLFLADLERFERGDLPDSRADLPASDARLNSLYGRLMKATAQMGTVTADGIRQTERLWIAYRDAWKEFGRVKYPNTKAESWLAWATQQRIDQLRALSGSR
jgi:hypothetical protein